jgi:hypothetical protein
MIDSKERKFKEALENFIDSSKNTEDYLSFIAVSHSVLQQGSGLLWEDLKQILDEVLSENCYNPFFGDERMCQCGHPYHRHFDSFEDMKFVGCKYCDCHEFKEKIKE